MARIETKCPNCGESLDVPDDFTVVCPMCGGHVEPVQQVPTEPAQLGHSRDIKLMFILWLVGMTSVAGWLVYMWVSTGFSPE